jgi:peptidoglycan/LPS O-acetylase OafA/YrhL
MQSLPSLSPLSQTLDRQFVPQRNSFGFFRLLFAASVIVQHTYVLGRFGPDPLSSLTAGQLSTGSIAVHGFFIISGFLVARSYLTASSVYRYLWHRILRIFPGFLACLLLTAVFFAPVLYLTQHGTLSGYLSATDSPATYLTKNFFLTIHQPDIANVTADRAERSLNGSLWTLELEFQLYLGVAALGVLTLLNRRPIVLALFTAWLIAYAIDGCHCRILLLYWTASRVVPLPLLFLSGTLFWLYRDRIILDARLFWLALFATAAAVHVNVYYWLEPIVFPYIVLWACVRTELAAVNRNADYSYGVYIYSFPIQQMIAPLGLGTTTYLLSSALLAVPFAMVSWHVVEKPCLGSKNFWRGHSLQSLLDRLRTASCTRIAAASRPLQGIPKAQKHVRDSTAPPAPWSESSKAEDPSTHGTSRR